MANRVVMRMGWLAVVALWGCGSVTIVERPEGDGGAGGAGGIGGGGGPVATSTSTSTGGTGGGPVVQACGGVVTDVLAIGSDGQDAIHGIVVHPSGDIFVAGATVGTTWLGAIQLPGAPGKNAVIARLSPSLEVIWAAAYGDANDQRIHAIALDPQGNLVVAGSSMGSLDFGAGPLVSANGDVFVASLTPDGVPLWSALLSGAGEDVAEDLSIDPFGRIVIAGRFEQSLTIGATKLQSAGDHDAFVASFDGNGTPLWAEAFGDDDFQGATSVATFGDGDIAVTGNTGGLIDFGAGPEGQAPNDVTLDAFLAKLDSNGDHLWSTVFVGPGMQRAKSLTVDGNDNLYTVGQFDNTVDFMGASLSSVGQGDIYLLKINAGGLAWAQRFGDAGIDNPRQVTTSPSGELFLGTPAAGATDFGCGPIGGSAGNPTGVALAFAADGTLSFSHLFGDVPDVQGHQYVHSVVERSDGALVVLGNFNGAAQIGDVAFTSQGQLDAFVAIVER